MSKLVIEIQEDGTLKTNAREMSGSEEGILATLEELAALAGGELKVEKHVGHHHHHGEHGHHHHHKGGQKH